MLYEVNILLLRQLDRFRQATSVLTNEQAVHDALALRCGADSQDEQDRTLVQEVFHAVVEDLPHGRMVFSHHTFHTVDRADHVALVDHVAAADADEQVLGVIRHADDLVRHDLTGGNDEVVALIHHAAIDLHADWFMPETFGDFFQIVCRYFADLDHIMPPVMDDHAFIGNALEHDLPLLFGHRLVCAKGRHNVGLHAPFGQQMVVDAGDFPRLRMEAREIRRDDEHLLERSSFQRRF